MLAEILAPLNHVLFTFWNDEVTAAEILGFVTGIGAVWLCVKAHILNFPVGIANALFFFLLFINAKLYADGILQLIYLGLGVFGWYAWLKLGPNRTELRVTSSKVQLAWGVAAAAAMTAILWPILKSANDVAPFLDALTTALSLSAQTLLCLKKLQNWWLWMIADVIYIPLYVSKGLALTAIVYMIFLAMCLVGYKEWRDLYYYNSKGVKVNADGHYYVGIAAGGNRNFSGHSELRSLPVREEA